MATEAVVLHQTSATDEQVEKKVSGEDKEVEQDDVSPSIETGPATPTTKSEEKTEDKQIEPPVVEDVKMIDETPVSDVPVGDSLKVGKDYIPDSSASSVSDLVADASKSQPEERRAIEPFEKESPEQLAVESIEKLPEDQLQIVDAPESSAETTEKPEKPLEALPVKEAQVVMKEIEDSEMGSMKVGEPDATVTKMKEKPAEQSELTEEVAKRCEVEPKENVESGMEKDGETLAHKVEEEAVVKEIEDSEVGEMKEKLAEQSEITKEVEKIEVEPKESVGADTVKDEETFAHKVEYTTILSKERTCKDEEPNVVNSSEQVVSSNQEAQFDQNGDSSLPGVVEKIGADEKYSTGIGVAEILSKEAVVEVEKVGREIEAKTATKEEENNKNSGEYEESTQATKVEDVNGSTSTAEVTEQSFQGENTRRDVELEVENKKDTKDEKTVLVESNKDEQAKGKLDEVATPVNELVKEFEESKLSAGEYTVKTGGDKLEKENDGEVAKSDVQNLEFSTKDGNETNASMDLPKEVPLKPAQKQSNNIISKVKHSLVKAKKAIIGKSPGLKTIAAENKGDNKVK